VNVELTSVHERDVGDHTGELVSIAAPDRAEDRPDQRRRAVGVSVDDRRAGIVSAAPAAATAAAATEMAAAVAPAAATTAAAAAATTAAAAAAAMAAATSTPAGLGRPAERREQDHGREGDSEGQSRRVPMINRMGE